MRLEILTLGRRAEQTGLPQIHLDREYWRPSWKEPGKNEWQACIEERQAFFKPLHRYSFVTMTGYDEVLPEANVEWPQSA